jgi:hypothetical protein
MAFFIAFFLCLPATWIANVTVIQPTTAIAVNGWLGEMTGAEGRKTFDAAMATNARSFASTPDVKVLGQFNILIVEDYRGWPLTTSVVRERAKLGLDLFGTPKAQEDVRLDANDPKRRAIENALAEDNESDALEHWRNGGTAVRQHWLNWFIAAGVWWILMVFASSFVIGIAQFIGLHVQRRVLKKRYEWRVEGKCHACGYDLTGLEFNERCPECGTLVQ